MLNDDVGEFADMVRAKAARDVARDRLVKALKGYDLPEELQKLLKDDDDASQVLWDAYVAHEAAKAQAAEKTKKGKR
jgi:hypothetical protein